jgi:hypothetical protein
MFNYYAYEKKLKIKEDEEVCKEKEQIDKKNRKSINFLNNFI